MENPDLADAGAPAMPSTPASDAGRGPLRHAARSRASAAADKRRRVAGILAGARRAVREVLAAIKAALLLLPKIKLLTTAGTALVSVAAYSLFWRLAVRGRLRACCSSCTRWAT